MLWVCPLLALAQTNDPAPAYAPNRFLLIVETSHPMQRRVQPLLQTIRDLLGSNLAGQGRRGDTLGVWTFNEELYTGLLPLQQWSPEDAKKLTERVTGFISAQKFEKRCRFDKITPALDRIVRSSPYLTVVLICFGDDEIHGTPYDQQINGFFKTWQLQQQDAGTPFAIAFRAQGGRYVDCTLNPSPWPPELPALPRQLLAPPTPVHPMVKETPKPATSPVPPLIISGKKREPLPAVSNAGSTPTNDALTSATVNAASPGQPAITSPATTIPTNPAITAKPDQPAATDASQSKSTPAQPAITAQPLEPSRPEVTSLNPVRSSADAKPGTVPPPATQPATSAPTSSMEQSMETPAPQTNAMASNSRSDAGLVTSPLAVQATTTFKAHRANPLLLAALGGLACVAVIAAVWLARRRPHAGPETSIITESLDRRKR